MFGTNSVVVLSPDCTRMLYSFPSLIYMFYNNSWSVCHYNFADASDACISLETIKTVLLQNNT